MKVVGLLLVVFLVSTEARFPKRLGTLFGKVMAKLPLRKPGAPSATPYAEPSAKKSPPAFCDTYDCPEFYEVKQDASSYTLRCYPKPYRWVSTSVTGNNYKQAGETAFWRLFSYIQDNNEEEMKIKMTVPVTMQIRPDTESESFSKNDYTMSFFIPFKHQKDAPAPSAEDVQLTDVPPFCAYVRVYRSRSNITIIEENYNALVEDLKTNGLGDDFRTDVIYSAGYNDPKDPNQHNEIWLVSKTQSPTPLPEKEAQSTFGEYFGKIVSKLSSKYLAFSQSIAKNILTKLPVNNRPGSESSEPSTEASVNKSSPAFCDKNDCPDFYEVKLNTTDYTLRCYPERYRWVSTTVTGERSKQAGKTAFWRLFQYISGNNAKKMKIKMTVPVAMQIQPVPESDSFCKNNFTMSFFVPFKHQKDAPAPSESSVQLTVFQPFCAYVRVYGGFSDMTMVEEEYKKLVEYLKRDGLGEEDYRTDVIYSAGYDSPWNRKLYNRHNEIWLISKNRSPMKGEIETL